MKKVIDTKYLINRCNIEKLKLQEKPALFLDRDGVLIEERHYLSDPEEVFLAKGAKELLKEAYKLNIPVVVVTNQSGIARNFFSWNEYEKVTKRMIDKIGNENPLVAIYANASHPKINVCDWRKPHPGMIIQAKKDFNFVLSDSILIGDRLSDIQAGINADLKCLIHLLTGHGFKERKIIKNYIKKNGKFSFNSREKPIHLIDSLKEVTLSNLI